ncbi:MAG: radical SAM protein, partial [Phycisphaerales bacterium]|nr:radical SAM protein [Phycisphaerales bacterium]
MPKPSTKKPAPAAPGNGDVQSVAFVSLGCPKNLVDSEKMLGLLAQDGLAVVGADAEGSGADAIVINTCGFLEASKEESLQVIHQAVKDKLAGKLKRVVVAGCLVQRHRAKLLEWAPGIDAMVGVFDRDHIVEAVRGAKAERKSLKDSSDQPKYWIAGNALVAAKERGLATTGLTVNGKDGTGLGYFEDDSARLRITPRHYAYLRMSEGCNQNCAFCTIPSIRGKMRSKPLDRIGIEAGELVADGTFELNLIGQDTTSYGMDLGDRMGRGESVGEPGLARVLRAASDAFDRASVDGWVRLMYAYPSNFTDAMIEAIASMNWTTGKGHVLPYIDIPLQHASDRMLTAMRRNVKASQQRDLMLKLRDRIPGMAIRTTFISGFPGETEADHDQLMAFVDEMGFEA